MRLPLPALGLAITFILTPTSALPIPSPQRYSHPNELIPPPPSPSPPTTEEAIFKTMTTPHIPTQEEGLGGRKGIPPPPPPSPPPPPEAAQQPSQPPRKSIGTVPPPLRDTPVNPTIKESGSSGEEANADENNAGAFNPKDIWGEGEDNPYDWPRREPEFGSLWRYPRSEPTKPSRVKRSREKRGRRREWRHWVFG
ncbi:hypothetical protein B0T21DRAFT_435886 [Apiosordaria backusii]|uniref:Uncharacterized protein n=1 Tax=Apiosordaria backusii TaxID=314023 RepID=A0AA40BRV8_9PEZI|nr:hypothetical protein B0T21DRAFT_435886 [Apiosordaria backusii]